MKRIFIIILLTLIILIPTALYIRIISLDSDDEEWGEDSDDWDNVIIHHGEDSVYNGYTPSELAEKLASSLDATPLKSREQESHGGVTWYRYYYQNTSIAIRLIKEKFCTFLGAPIEIHGGKNPEINISNNPSKAIDSVLDIWKEFLNSLNYQLAENDYNINLESSISNWKVYIRQTCNDNLSLKNTGIKVNMEKETSRISSISLFEWSKIKIERNIPITMADAKDIIINELQEYPISRSELNYTGYIYFSDNVHYYFKYEVLQTNETRNVLAGHS
ncbi:MAG: hypothetical protein JSV49_02730, partial [Thermoplasmata archaeon]